MQEHSQTIFKQTKISVDNYVPWAYTPHIKQENKMIVAKESIKEFINSQKSVESLADKIDVVHSTLYSVVKGNGVSSDVVAKLLTETGFDFEKAFEVKE